MADGAHASIVREDEPQRIRADAPVRSCRRRQQRHPRVRGAEALLGSEMRGPSQHVVDRGHDGAFALDLLGRKKAASPVPILSRQVQRSHAGKDHVIAWCGHGVVHAQWSEQALFEQRFEGGATGTLGSDRQQVVTAVVVDHRVARREIAPRLSRLHSQRRAGGRGIPAMSEKGQVDIVSSPTTMQHQLVDRRLPCRTFELRNIGADRRVQPDLSFFRKQHKKQAGEMLAGGADSHSRRRAVRDGRL